MAGDKLFPAHAGMNRRQMQEIAYKGAVPRTRGDEPGDTTTCRKSIDCSPHTRG